MIRLAVREDIPQLMEIYNYAVINTTATFDMECVNYENRVKWFEEHEVSPYVLYVDVDEEAGDEVVTGYASLSLYRERKAFSKTVEVSIYIKKEFQGKGIGKLLMKKVLDYAAENDKIHLVVSLIEGSNQTSINLHKKFGFEFCGKTHEVGYKFDKWLDLEMYELKV